MALKNHSIEILAPAGSWQAMEGAVSGGCHAVYMGGVRFGARAFAGNLEQQDLLRAIDYVHLHQVKLYLTLNTLIKEREFESLYQDLKPLYEQGLDAVIIQDIGAAAFIREQFPDLPVHGSTQMSITGPGGASMAERAGMKRIILARELNLEEIHRIKQSTALEIETFVHGALCFCYSGQCLMSSMLGGRSGNRGRCAQPCRLPYSLPDIDGRKAHLLSPKDICTLELIPELAEAGIDSFKIEGRMKRAEYAAYTSYLYRKYLELYLELGREAYERYRKDHAAEFDRDLMSLAELYNRGGFTAGYYHQYNGKNMMALVRPGHFGVKVGEVTDVSEKNANARLFLTEDVNAQDVLEIRSREQAAYEYTAGSEMKAGSRPVMKFNKGLDVRPDSQVYRMKNQKLLSGIKERFLKQEKKEEAAAAFKAAKGSPLKLTLEYAGKNVTVEGKLPLSAEKRPVTEQDVIKQLNKTGNTAFYFTELQIEMEEGLFIPNGWLGELKREGLAELGNSVCTPYRRAVARKEPEWAFRPEHVRREAMPDVSVRVCSLEQLHEVLPFREITGIYLEMAAFTPVEAISAISEVEEAGRKIYAALPCVFRNKDVRRFTEDFNKIGAQGKQIHGFLVRNYEGFQWAVDFSKHSDMEKEIILDSGLYTCNRNAIQEWKRLGMSRFTAPPELNRGELEEMDISRGEIIVYGYLPLMTTVQCMLSNQSDGCSGSGNGKQRLEDRFHKDFYVMPFCRYCYNILLNGVPLSLDGCESKIKELGPRGIRLDFTIEQGREVHDILMNFISVFHRGAMPQNGLKETTKGHFINSVK